VSGAPSYKPTLAAVLLLFAACSVQPPTRPLDSADLETRARAEAQAGHAGNAAELYGRLADMAVPPARGGYLITAARLLVEARQYAAARRYVNAAIETALPAQRLEITALTAEIDLDQGDATAAFNALAAIPDTVDAPLRAEMLKTRGRALFALRRYTEAVRDLTDREVWLDTSAQVLENQQLIWEGLSHYSGQSAPAPSGDRIVDGWLALAPLASAAADPDTLKRALIEWREQYPDHPAAGGYLAELLAARRGANEFPRQIALLLPLSSAQQAAAIAIRDGFIAAYLEHPSAQQAALRVYDTTLLGSAEAYLQAQLEGADFIVGPLLRPEVEQVAGQVGFVPTLALNFLPNEPSAGGGFFQFALAPEDEAREIARHAVAAGATTSLALLPNSDLGNRLLASFRDEFQALGGQLLAAGTYDPEARDFSVPITTLLNVSGSNQRFRRLTANLRTPIEFEPRRRQDADMLFIAASPSTGRQLAPQLRFHYAGDIPTYATSDIYDASRANPDNDLNGLYFPDAPWLLNPSQDAQQLKSTLARYWPQRTPWIRLYGMGYDAYDLIPALYNHLAPAPTMQSVSGELWLDEAGRIHRHLLLAQFRDGRPVPLETQMPVEQPADLAQLGE
jgi:uncharacterized protein